jgi:hypothetical protein
MGNPKAATLAKDGFIIFNLCNIMSGGSGFWSSRFKSRRSSVLLRIENLIT